MVSNKNNKLELIIIKGVFEKIMNILYPLYKYFDKNTIIIEPNGIFIFIWDIFYFFLLTISAFYTPIKFGFFYFKDDPPFSKYFNLSIYFYYIDMVIRMNLGIFLNGEIENKRSIIILNYFKNQFFLDSISLIPYTINLYFIHSKLLEIILLLRCLQLKKLVNNVILRLKLNERNYHFYDLLSLFFLIFYVINLSACVWYFIGTVVIQFQYGNSWLQNNNFIDEPFHIKYIGSFYISVLTMITAGSYNTQNYIEQVTAIFIMIVLAGFFAYSINTLGSIMQEINKYDKQLR